VSNPDFPSDELCDVITSILEPIHFQLDSHDRKKALETLNGVLGREGLQVIMLPDGVVNLISQGEKRQEPRATRNASTQRFIQVSPKVFTIPKNALNTKLVSVMMPFDAGFTKTYEAIKNACSMIDMECRRADDMWENDAIIQDIFELIYCSQVVIADLTGKNPNVLYEVGLAHTLGKDVILITQNESDVPFDLRHLRFVKYLNNDEGLARLYNLLEGRLKTLLGIKGY
jgi:nucleoside 2-deoxyribosyltransferase